MLVSRYGGNKKGISLLITIALCSAIILTALGVSKIIIKQMQSASYIENSTAAYYAAEAGMELAFLYLKGTPVGYNLETKKITMDLEKGRKAEIEIIAKNTSQTLNTARGYEAVRSDLFLLPSPFKGSAGQGKCKSSLPPLPTGYEQMTSPTLFEKALEHPCNWNKIALGETVSIPLYSLASDNKTEINPYKGNGIKEFYLRLRTPCLKYGKDDFECDNTHARPDLWVDLSDVEITDNVIVNWEIDALDQNGEMLTLLAKDDRESRRIINKIYEIYTEKKNTQIYESKINKSKWPYGISEKYIALKDTWPGCKDVDNKSIDTKFCGGKDIHKYQGSIMEFLTKRRQQEPATGTKNWDLLEKNKPYLKFTVIHPLVYRESNVEHTLPYLEYQVITDKTIATNFQDITVHARVNDFSQTLEARKEGKTSILEYAVHN